MLNEFFPQELAQLRAWTPSAYQKESICKVPLMSWKQELLTLAEAQKQFSGYNYGFYVMKNNPFIVIDIDGTTEIPSVWPPTLAEISSSGNGVHLFYKTKQKAALRRSFSLNTFTRVAVDKCFTLVTGNAHPSSTGEIADISSSFLYRCQERHSMRPAKKYEFEIEVVEDALRQEWGLFAHVNGRYFNDYGVTEEAFIKAIAEALGETYIMHESEDTADGMAVTLYVEKN
jgi:hypothetical protein